MSYLDPDSIEHMGITELRNAFYALHPDIKTNFAENDKIPFTDGDISFYSNGNGKEYFQGKINVQIKSTTQEKVKKNKTFYDLSLATLRGFKKLNGVLLFVVYVDSDDRNKNLIFYQVLSIPYLSKIINEDSSEPDSGKKTISIKLSPFPSSDEDKKAILKDVFHELENSKYDISNPINPPKRVYTSPYLFNTAFDFDHVIKLTENRLITLYSDVNSHLEPTYMISNENLKKLIFNQDCIIVSFGEFGDFKGSIVTLQEKNSPTKVTIKTGREKCLEITLIIKKDREHTVKNSSATIHKAKDIDNQIFNLQLLQYISEGNQISLDGNPIIQAVNQSETQEKRIRDNLEFFQIIKEANSILGIDLYNTDGLNDNDLNGMNELINTYRDYKEFKDNEIRIVCPKIKDKYYGFVFIAGKVLSFFDPKLDENIYLCDKESKQQLNPYLIATNKTKPISLFYHYDPYLIQKWYSKNPYRSSCMVFHFLLYWLNIAETYKKDPNDKFLDDFEIVYSAFILGDFKDDQESRDLCCLIKNHFFKTKKGNLNQDEFDNINSISKKKYQDDDVNDFIETYAKLLLGINVNFNSLSLNKQSISVLKKIRDLVN